MRSLAIAFIFLSSYGFAQSRLAPFIQLNAASHWIKNDNEPSRHAYSFRSGLGAGIKYDLNVNQFVSLSFRARYSQKGYQSRSNTLHYVGLDQVIQISPMPNTLKFAYLALGINNDRLVKKRFSDPLIDHNVSGKPIDLSFNKWSVGSIIGVGYWLDKLTLEAGINFDVAPSLVIKDELELRNYLWYFNFGFQLF
ncbi:MAG: hypothetical protein RIC35_04490 [Marinoscillum sp.]